MEEKKYVYFFGDGKAEGDKSMKDLLGGKGANLAEMNTIGVRVPAGFTISTEVCDLYYKNNKKHSSEVMKQIDEGIMKLEESMGKKLGDSNDPLLVSVRSGAAISMPGMMDTVLNLGLNDASVKGLIEKTGNSRFVWDSYRRFIQMFGDVVMEVAHARFEEALESAKKTKGVAYDTDLTAEDLKMLVEEYKRIVRVNAGEDFPQNPREQLQKSIDAVFGSWHNDRAIVYRRLNDIKGLLGTAVNVQAMVYGNMGETSGTGVAFTRNPSTGENLMYGEFLMNAQGEDVVAGIRTPRPINELKEVMPVVFDEFMNYSKKLEEHYHDMQDLEFTIQEGKLYFLQTRGGKRTAAAAVRIAVEMVKEGMINKKQAVLRVDPNSLDQLLHPMLDPIAKGEASVLGRGLPASPGAAVGKAVFSAEKAMEMNDLGEKVVLVRVETSPEDIEGMHAAVGILTARGGMTCIAGDGKILTNKGFLSAERAFEVLEEGEKLIILSYDSKTGQTKWKKIIAAGRKLSDVIEINVSQTGRAKENTLKITSDHKMMIFGGRDMIKRKLSDVIKSREFVNIVDKIPSLGLGYNNLRLAYFVGAIFTDGYISLKRTKGSITFTQKECEEKMEFINYIKESFGEVFGKEPYVRTKSSNCYLRGRQIQGEAMDMICYGLKPTMMLSKIGQNIVPWVLSLDKESTLNFLAGIVDGDGGFYNGRIQIYASKENVKQGVITACLKLGIVPQVTFNRGISNIQIVEEVGEILKYTRRIKGEDYVRKYGSKLFSIKQLFGDIVSEVNYKGRVKEAIKRNLLFDSKKICRDILPLCNDKLKSEILKILSSEVRMYRISKNQDLGKTYVYNFEVDSKDEVDKNFVVFTKNYTPLLVSNSHAAVVARGMGKCCVSGCGELDISEVSKEMKIGSTKIREGEYITLDGSTGDFYNGRISVKEPELSGTFAELMTWADEFRRLKVRTNADTPKDAETAIKFGAEGIGLCRTEHMFFDGARIKAMREMILADDVTGRKRALIKLLPYQKQDFIGLFRVMAGKPVTIRLLDPPLHEFLPREEEEIVELSREMGVSVDKLKGKIKELHEFNPMLGHRGCRLGISYPEITEMQATAICEAAIETNAIPEIMIPLVGNSLEFKHQKEVVLKVCREIMRDKPYLIGTMIEVPRGALTANEIAQEVDFFSFGTNDLTQMTCGFSRDDSGKFLKEYVELGIYDKDPFQVLDREGVGQLVRMAARKGRKVKPDLKLGICGEHGGEPSSVEFCHIVGLDYVSCSPYRVPIARLAAAHAELNIPYKRVVERREFHKNRKKSFFKGGKNGKGNGNGDMTVEKPSVVLQSNDTHEKGDGNVSGENDAEGFGENMQVHGGEKGKIQGLENEGMHGGENEGKHGLENERQMGGGWMNQRR